MMTFEVYAYICFSLIIINIVYNIFKMKKNKKTEKHIDNIVQLKEYAEQKKLKDKLYEFQKKRNIL